MTVPFEPRPGDPDADNLNTILDATRSGTRKPDAASPESTEAAALANAAGQLRGLVRRADAPAAAYLEENPLQHRWEDIMHTAIPTAPPYHADAGTFAPSAPVSNRTRKLAAPPSPSNRLNGWLSAAIVALMLLGTIGGAWWLGPGGSGPSDDGAIRLAAVTQEDASPEAFWPEPLTPETDPWVAAISPEECTAEPLPQEDFAEAITTDPGLPERSYEIVGPADSANVEEAVATLRAEQACSEAGLHAEARSYFTDTGLFFLGPTADNIQYQDSYWNSRMSVAQEWSALLEISDDYSPITLVTGVEPPEQAEAVWEESRAALDLGDYQKAARLVIWEFRYTPDQARMLSDGRMMVPQTAIYWEQDPYVQAVGFGEDPDILVASTILADVDGEWRIDELYIPLCFGGCEHYWSGQGMATPVASPIATPED